MALRQQVWVDRRVQGVLVGRVILYWICAFLYVGVGWACFQYNQNPDWTLTKHIQVLFSQMWPWLPTAVLILPLAIYDVVRMSNLFAGPVFRLRKHFAALREDIACAPLTFREEDYWRDLAAPINDMQAEILRLRNCLIDLQNVSANSLQLSVDFSDSNAHATQPTTAPAAVDISEVAPETVSEKPIAVDSKSETVAESAAEPTFDESKVAIAPLPTPVVSDTPLETAAVVPTN